MEELKEVCRWLTDKVNETADQGYRDANERMTLESVNVEQEAVAAMENLSEEYKALQGSIRDQKALLNHWILSVQNLTGVYSPFTVKQIIMPEWWIITFHLLPAMNYRI